MLGSTRSYDPASSLPHRTRQRVTIYRKKGRLSIESRAAATLCVSNVFAGRKKVTARRAAAMEASNAGASHIPIYISSDEDDDHAPFYDPYILEDIEIQQAILLSLDSPGTATAAASASASTSSPRPNVCTTLESPPDQKGKRKLSPEGTLTITEILNS